MTHQYIPRQAGADRASVEIAIGPRDRQTRPVHHVGEFFQRIHPHGFVVASLRAIFPDPHLFIDPHVTARLRRIPRYPPPLLDFHALHGAAVGRHERGDDEFAVQVVHEEASAGPQRPRDGIEDPGVLAVLLEITEAGEEIDDEIEGGDPGRIAHVAPDERDVQPFTGRAAARPFEQVFRQVESGHPVAAPGELEAVPAVAAAEVQYIARRKRFHAVEEEIDLASRFFVVPMGIHPEVVVTKGGFVPVRCRTAM